MVGILNKKRKKKSSIVFFDKKIMGKGKNLESVI